ncbi:MAG TPA: carboxypeptidase-like regulatory domain-containing protein [Terriglobales bacterium]|nr:carboxypeptidase-like regulatory domain-containing protein [Terriglobales bacterium]
MMNRQILTVCLLLSSLLVPAWAEKKPAIPLSTVNFIVVRDENAKPIRNAAVVLHPVEDNGKQDRGGIELKTDPDGKANYDGVPYGKMRIQVLAPGFQTFGNDYDIARPMMEITIKLKRPEKQYSIYEDHSGDKQPKDQKPQ